MNVLDRYRRTESARAPLEDLEDNGLSRRVELHDRNQLELKLGYRLDPRQKSETYEVEAFVFISKTLGVASHSYSKRAFYKDTTAFLRFQTPRVPLSDLATRTAAEPWFEALSSVEVGEDLNDHVRILACVYRSALRSAVRPLRAASRDLREVSAGRLDADVEWLSDALASFVVELESAHTRWKASRKRVAERQSVGPGSAWAMADEYIAAVIQDVVTGLLASLDRALRGLRARRLDGEGSVSSLTEARDALARACVRVDRYGRSQEHLRSLTITDEDHREHASREAFPYRSRLLKRAMFSPMYLEARGATRIKVARNLAAMLAAMLAMAFAITAAIWSQLEWGLMTWPFVVVALVSYMIKDRIKEWGRSYLPRRFKRFFPDHIKIIRAKDGRELGLLRETFELKDPEDCPAEVVATRHQDPSRALAREARPEVVLAYAKRVALSRWAADSGAFSSWFVGVHDIIRFNIGRLRSRMDAVEEDYRWVDPETLDIVNVPTERVYHVNIVLRYRVGRGGPRSIERIRLVVDQKGIKRVEEVDIVPPEPVS